MRKKELEKRIEELSDKLDSRAETIFSRLRELEYLSNEIKRHLGAEKIECWFGPALSGPLPADPLYQLILDYLGVEVNPGGTHLAKKGKK